MSDDNLRVFGIDLGTTYSAVAYVDEAGRPSVCRNFDGMETTPSVVYFESDSNVIVGSVAKNSVITYPDQVVSLVKRAMGSDATYQYHGKTYTPESISALILKQLAEDAAQYTGGAVSKVVITVPAYFGMLERDATKKAGTLAGLDVIGIVPEPVAAALHYEATTNANDRTILVYDLGGGTFDTTVIQVNSDDIEVICTDGNDRLGGADWDERLQELLLAKFREQVPPDTDVDEDAQFLSSLVIIAEDTKKMLSRADVRPVGLRGAGVAARVEVSRAEFESATEDLLNLTIDVVRRTLDTLAEKRPGTTIDEVLLVGGSTKMPAVATRLRAEFGWEPRIHDPELAVARGAALFALGRIVISEQQNARAAASSDAEADALAAKAIAAVADQTGLSVQMLKGFAKETHNVLPKAFGVKLVDTSDSSWRDRPTRYYVKHLVHANDTLPTGWRELSAATIEDGQQEVEIDLYEQSGVVAGADLVENKQVNVQDKTISGFPPLPAGSPVDIQLRVDAEGLLELEATERSTGTKLKIEVKVSVLSEEQTKEQAEHLSGLTVSSL